MLQRINSFFLLNSFFQITFAIANIKTLNVDGNGFIYSQGYPNQYVTGNGDSDYYDWMIASKNWLNLAVFFDRLGLNEQDILQFCTSDQYYRCLDSSAKCPGCVDKPRPFWYPEMGPMFAYYRPFTNSSIVTRNGFHAAVIEVDPNSEGYFTCGQTSNISLTKGQSYFVSQGFPSITTRLQRCVTDIVAMDGIRLRIPELALNVGDYFHLYGMGLDGKFQNISLQFSEWSSTVYTAYFAKKVTIDFRFGQGTYEEPNFFTLYAEAFNVTTPSCLAFGQQNFVDQEFEIYTPNYYLNTFENYPNNMMCNWSISGVTGSSQIILEIVEIQFETDADFFSSKEFDFQISEVEDTFDSYKALLPGNTNATFQITSDALENGLGLHAKLHILDCTCSGGNYKLDSSNPTYRFRMPIDVTGLSRTPAYCQGIDCGWSFVVDPGQNVTVQFTENDCSYGEEPLVYADGKLVAAVYDTSTFHLSNKTQINITWESSLGLVGDNPFPSGFKFVVFIGTSPLEETTTTQITQITQNTQLGSSSTVSGSTATSTSSPTTKKGTPTSTISATTATATAATATAATAATTATATATASTITAPTTSTSIRVSVLKAFLLLFIVFVS